MEKETKKSDLRIIRTKKLLRNTLLQLLEEKKFENITVSELTARAGINRKTFYLHYASTRDLLDEIQDELLAKFIAIISHYDLYSPDFRPYDFFIELSQFLEHEYEEYRSILFFTSDGISVAKIKRALLNSSIKRLQSVHKVNKIRLDFYIDYTISGLLSLYLNWFSHKPPLVSIEELADIASEICYHGLDDIVEKLKETAPADT